MSRFELFLQRFAFFGFGFLSHLAFESFEVLEGIRPPGAAGWLWGPASRPLLRYIGYETSTLTLAPEMVDAALPRPGKRGPYKKRLAV